MDRKKMCVSNVRYKKPSMNEAKRMRNLLGYLTYRDSRTEAAPAVSGVERWVDRGMGKSVNQIAKRLDGYRSEHVLAFSLVVNPNPNLIEMIPLEKREQFVRQLTERTVEDFFVEREIDTGVEFSYVIHHRQTEDDNAPGRHNPHAHVVLPGTYYHADEGRRVPLYFSKNKSVNHIQMIHEITQQNMGMLMDRYVGRDWERRYDELYPEPEKQPEVIIARTAPKLEIPDYDLSLDL